MIHKCDNAPFFELIVNHKGHHIVCVEPICQLAFEVFKLKFITTPTPIIVNVATLGYS